MLVDDSFSTALAPEAVTPVVQTVLVLRETPSR